VVWSTERAVRPIAPRRVAPNSRSCWITTFAKFAGTEKPTPTEPPASPVRNVIAVLMPTTSPRRLNSGPPELPLLMAASVWMKSSVGARADIAVAGGDDAGCDGAAEAERVADSDDPLADFGGIRRRPRNGRQRIAGLELQQGQVDGFVGTDQLGPEHAAIRQDDVDLVCAFDDVVVGDDIAGGVDDEAGAKRGPGDAPRPARRPRRSLNSLSGEVAVRRPSRPSPRATVWRVAMLNDGGTSGFSPGPRNPRRSWRGRRQPGAPLGWAMANSGACTSRRAGAKNAPAMAADTQHGNSELDQKRALLDDLALASRQNSVQTAANPAGFAANTGLKAGRSYKGDAPALDQGAGKRAFSPGNAERSVGRAAQGRAFRVRSRACVGVRRSGWLPGRKLLRWPMHLGAAWRSARAGRPVSTGNPSIPRPIYLSRSPLMGVGREGDDRRRVLPARFGAQALDRFLAVHDGHVDIEQDDVEIVPGDQVERFLAVGRLGRPRCTALRGEEQLDDLAVDGVVVGETGTRSPRRLRLDGSVVRDLPGTVLSAGMASCALNVRRKVEPCPLSLVTVMSPPIMRASWREMARPRPEPPNLRVVAPSACVKTVNSLSVVSSDMPMPVSETSTTTMKVAPSRRLALRATSTRPSEVNLMAL